ncbi:endonuclease NucS domain-containing protein [Streptomyces sp. SAS_281]|uniref:endonuclease NucS domain-containing protein n=1 Tax=Streptomyces sp. SAS_281 TaxID=3412744 RepID=UPI00403C1277
MPRLADVEADVQSLIEAHMEAMLGVRFLASEYVIGCADGGRIDSLGLDENGAPVIVEYKRGTDAGVINQGLYYMAWLVNHKDVFRNLVRDRLGVTAASQILWSAPRLICVAGDFTRYDAHAVREHRRSIDLVRYQYFGRDHFSLETVASVTGRSAQGERERRRAAGEPLRRKQGGAMSELAQAVDEVLVGLGGNVTRVQRKQYCAYQRLRNFACLIPPQQVKVVVYLKVAPAAVDLVPGFTRDVTGLGHHGTGDLEVQLRTEGDLERAQELFRLSYAAA